MARDVLDLTGDAAAKDTSWKDGPKRPDPLPKGWYTVSIYDAEDKTTRPEKGSKPYLSLTLKVQNEGDYYGRTVFDNFVGKYVTEKAKFLADKAKQLSAIAGLWDGADPKIVLPAAEDVIGLEVEVFVGLEEDTYAMEQEEKETGKAPEQPIYRNRFNAYRPVGGFGEAGAKKKTKRSVVV